MVIQFLYSPFCCGAELPHVYALASNFTDCRVEKVNIFLIGEGEENSLPGEIPSIIRALRRGEGFLTTGIIFVDGEMVGGISDGMEEIKKRIKEKRGIKGENNPFTH